MLTRCLSGLTVLLLAAAVPTHAQRPNYAVGEVVEVKAGLGWQRARVVEAGDGVWKVRRDGDNAYMDEWAGTDRLRRVGATARAATARPALVDAQWEQVSVTTPRGQVQSNGAYVGLTLYARGSRWDLVTTTTSGTGVQLLGRGTFRMAGERLVMTHGNGQPYGDFAVSWDAAEQLLLLTSRDGSVMRLRHRRAL